MTKYSVSIIPSHHRNCQKSTNYILLRCGFLGLGFLMCLHCSTAGPAHAAAPHSIFNVCTS